MKSKKYNNSNNINKTIQAPNLCNTISPQEALFVAYYIKDWNELKALKESKLYPYKASKEYVKGYATKLLQKPLIQKAIQDAIDYKAETILGNKDTVIAHLFRMLKADPLTLKNEDGTLKNMKDIPYSTRCCISEFKVRTKYRKDENGDMIFDGYTTDIKMESRLGAAKELLRILVPQAQINLTQNNITTNTVDLSHLNTKDKIDSLIELLSNEPKDEQILELEKIEECSLAEQ